MRDRVNQLSYQQYTFRNRADVLRFFDGLEMTEPELVQIQQWRPDVEATRPVAGWARVARKPWAAAH